MWFNFGVANYSREASIEDVRMHADFLDDGVEVIVDHRPPGPLWTTDQPNKRFNCYFGSISASEAYNGASLLRVRFPRAGQYTIRTRITARNLRPVIRDLSVILK